MVQRGYKKLTETILNMQLLVIIIDSGGGDKSQNSGGRGGLCWRRRKAQQKIHLWKNSGCRILLVVVRSL